MSKGGSYSGFCDNNPTQCSDSLGSCGGRYSDENKAPFEDKKQDGGGYYLDVLNVDSLGHLLNEINPEYVINCCGRNRNT